MKYEYKVVYKNFPFMGELEEWLIEIGNTGWRVIQVRDIKKVHKPRISSPQPRTYSIEIICEREKRK
jgi:hypothetical protein